MLMTVLLAAIPLQAWAEYLIYLKGGHYIVADNCTFSTRQESGKGRADDSEATPELLLVEDCTEGKPEGQIFWSTISGSSGEVNPDDVYAIFGSKNPASLKPPRSTMPLEDYLITNRGESIVNAKEYKLEDKKAHAVKREDLARIDRRSISEIAPEGEAKTRSGEGLCPGEPPEFSVTEADIVDGNLVGVVTNLSKTPWQPRIDVEVQVKGRRLGKFRIVDSNNLAPDDSALIDQAVPSKYLKYVKQITDPEAGVRICYRKVKTGTEKASK